MTLNEEPNIQIKAQHVMTWIYRLIEDVGLVDEMCNTYSTFCNSDDARRLGIKARTITDETRLRLLFELLCFSVFNVSLLAPKYFTERSFLRKSVNYELASKFYHMVGDELFELCSSMGVNNLHQIEILAIEPEIKFGSSDDYLNPYDRLTRYAQGMIGNIPEQNMESNLNYFSVRMAVALDSQNYVVTKMIGATYAITVTEMASRAMNDAFKK